MWALHCKRIRFCSQNCVNGKCAGPPPDIFDILICWIVIKQCVPTRTIQPAHSTGAGRPVFGADEIPLHGLAPWYPWAEPTGRLSPYHHEFFDGWGDLYCFMIKSSPYHHHCFILSSPYIVLYIFIYIVITISSPYHHICIKWCLWPSVTCWSRPILKRECG